MSTIVGLFNAKSFIKEEIIKFKRERTELTIKKGRTNKTKENDKVKKCIQGRK